MPRCHGPLSLSAVAWAIARGFCFGAAIVLICLYLWANRGLPAATAEKEKEEEEEETKGESDKDGDNDKDNEDEAKKRQ